jgi:hypothetical protein
MIVGPTSHVEESRTETRSVADGRRTSVAEPRWAPMVA